MTPAVRYLEQAGIPFRLLKYDYSEKRGEVGMEAASALGIDGGRMLKTLMFLAERKPICVVLPSNLSVSPRKLARVLSVKSVSLMDPKDAERISGYRVGGISPFGQRNSATKYIEETAFEHEEVYVNAGRRGLVLNLRLGDAQSAMQASRADLV